MAPHRNGKLVLKFLYSCTLMFLLVESRLQTDYQTVDDCKKGQRDNFHEMYDISNLKCVPCAQPSSIQTTTPDS